MTDLDLIEAAAKAAGHQTAMCYEAWPEGGEPFAYAKLAKRTYFRPFSDDGDAFRLAVKLRIKALYNDRLGSALAWYGGANDFQATVEDGGRDEPGSVRRAIVLAAARCATPAPAQPDPLHVANERGEGEPVAWVSGKADGSVNFWKGWRLSPVQTLEANLPLYLRPLRSAHELADAIRVLLRTMTDDNQILHESRWLAAMESLRASLSTAGAGAPVAARQQALQEAHDAMFDIKGDKVTRFDAQTAIRNLMDAPKEKP